MEDSCLDWDKLEDEREVEKGSGFGWVLSKGLNLGKNLVITGVVVSSVPIIVPPLLVVSALGFAFSVPFGFMYASYTCTEKLMSKLLPTSSPHVIEYGEGEVVGSEEKGKGQLDDGFSEGMMNYQEELVNENDGVILVKESEEGLSTVSEFGEEEERLWYDGIVRSEEGLSTVTEFGKDEEGLQYNDIIRNEEGVSSTFSELQKEEGLQYDGINRVEEGIDEEGSRKNNVNMSEEGLSTGTEFRKDEVLQKNEVNINEDGFTTGAEFGKGGKGLQKDDMRRGATNGYRVSDEVMVIGDLDVPNKEHMQYSGIDNREMSVEEIGVEVNWSGIEEGRETKETDDAISHVQIIPSADEMNDDRSDKEVSQGKVENKTDAKLGGERNDVHGSKGMDKGKKRHTNAKGRNKTQKTLKRVEGDVSEAHEKDVVKPEIISGKADVSLESENKLNLDKNVMQLPAQDVVEEKITDVVMISKENEEPCNLSTSIGDIDENNKNADLLESETTTNEPRDQASNVSVLVPVLEVSDSKSVPVLIQHEELVELNDDSVHVEGNDLPRNKEMPGDEEIWKQRDSIRTIVGFKVARHTSFFEELKALYVFIGIEPASLFKDPFDTAEVCDKLRFLMSMIGVK